VKIFHKLAVLDDAGALESQGDLGDGFSPHPKEHADPHLSDERILAVCLIECTQQETAEALFDGVVLATNAQLGGLRDQGGHVTQQQML
jgi:hypothetical protein